LQENFKSGTVHSGKARVVCLCCTRSREISVCSSEDKVWETGTQEGTHGESTK